MSHNYARNFQQATLDEQVIATWYNPTYIDPSDLSAIDTLEVVAEAVRRPYLLSINGNVQAFPTLEQREKYLKWRLSLTKRS